jgi:hypothetical protein
MIFSCNFEEVRALEEGARAVLEEPVGEGAVAAPSAVRAAVESLLPQLTGDLAFQTLAEQDAVERGVRAVVEHLRQVMDAFIVATHPAGEPAVAAYFDYAHALSVLHRLEEVGREMRALFELLHGAPADPVDCHTFVFPD